MKIIQLFLFIVLFAACSSVDNENAIYQSKRKNIVNVKEDLKEFNHEDVYLMDGRFSFGGNYVFVRDFGINDKFVHLFSRDDLSYVGSFGDRGEGPGEIITIGDVMLADDGEKAYVVDMGHDAIYQYDVDSALVDSKYKPQIKQRLPRPVFPSWVTFFSDTLAYGKLVRPNAKSFREEAGKWNLLTGEVKELVYHHPDIKNKRIMLAASLERGIYVEANLTFDLLSIFDLEGNLLRNVYGPDWDSRGDVKQHFCNVAIYKNYILATYSGLDWVSPIQPHLCHVFDINGNYLKTFDLGYHALRMAVDEKTDRLFFCFDDELQFAYLDLKEVL